VDPAPRIQNDELMNIGHLLQNPFLIKLLFFAVFFPCMSEYERMVRLKGPPKKASIIIRVLCVGGVLFACLLDLVV
jgi:hypothetical protein